MTPGPPETWWPRAPRLPGPGTARAAGRRPFGSTWWGRAWVDALEHRAQLDPNRLPRGRTYARTGAVGELTLGAGQVSAPVQGSRRSPYAVTVRVRTFSDEEWDQVLDALAAQIGHAAALLDGELPPEIADDVRSVGLDLLPGPGELQPRCSCPDWADPCKHAAAVCYLVADSLDDDPFVLLALRGLDRDQLLAALRARRGVPGSEATAPGGPGSDDDPSADPGVVARDAWRRPPSPMPVVPLPVRTPGRPTVLGVDPPPGLGVDAAALRRLAADAAARALDLALGSVDSGLELDHHEDLARHAALLLGTADAGEMTLLARRAGLPSRELLRRAVAWRDGGLPGLSVLLGPWDPPPEAIAPGRTAMGPTATVRRNRVTGGGRQLRLGTDGRWYPFRKVGADWEPDGPPLQPEALGSGPPG